jgi:flagellin-like protein
MRRAGVSPVIATLLLIVIAVAAAVLAYIWIIGYQGTLTQQASTAQLQERIKIEAVQYSDNTLTVYVRNIGDVKVNVTALYLYDPTGTVIKANTTANINDLTPGSIGQGSLTTVTLTAGTTYTVKAVTSRGTEATYTFTYRT